MPFYKSDIPISVSSDKRLQERRKYKKKKKKKKEEEKIKENVVILFMPHPDAGTYTDKGETADMRGSRARRCRETAQEG